MQYKNFFLFFPPIQYNFKCFVPPCSIIGPIRYRNPCVVCMPTSHKISDSIFTRQSVFLSYFLDCFTVNILFFSMIQLIRLLGMFSQLLLNLFRSEKNIIVCTNIIKNKVRSQLTNKNLESCLKLKTTSYGPNLSKLSKTMQSQRSH